MRRERIWSFGVRQMTIDALSARSLNLSVAECKSYLEGERYTWKHNAVVLFLSRVFAKAKVIELFAALDNLWGKCFTMEMILGFNKLLGTVRLQLRECGQLALLQFTCCHEQYVSGTKIQFRQRFNVNKSYFRTYKMSQW